MTEKLNESDKADLESAVATLTRLGIWEWLSDDQLNTLVRMGDWAKVIMAAREESRKAFDEPLPLVAFGSNEHKKLIDALKLEKGLKDAINTQEAFGFLENYESPPNFDQILQTITPEMLVSAMAFQSPQLILIPGKYSFRDMMRIAERKGPHKAYIHSRSWVDEERIHKWQAYLVEDIAEVKVSDFDNVEQILYERLLIFNAYKERRGVQGMNSIKYLAFMLQNLVKNRPISTSNWTILDEDIFSMQTLVPRARANLKKRVIEYDTYYTNRPRKTALFCRSVGGKIKTA